MGAITPIATGLNSIASTIGTVSQIANTVQTLSGNSPARRTQEGTQALALQQLQERQRLSQQQATAQTTLDRERLTVETQKAEQDRQRALRRAVARQRASFGGQGISTNNGSAQAILLGLFEESEDDLTQRTSRDNLRTRSLDLGLENSTSLNILQRTQLQQRQNLNTISGFGGLF